jgi:hypothetical protein
MNITVVGIGVRRSNHEFKSYLCFKSCGEVDSSVVAKNHCEKIKEEIHIHNKKLQDIRHRRNVFVEPYKDSLAIGGKDESVLSQMEKIGNDIRAYEKARSVLPYADPLKDVMTEKIEELKAKIEHTRLQVNVGLTQADRCRMIEEFRNQWDSENLTPEERELLKIGDKNSFDYTFIVKDIKVVDEGEW